MATVIANQSDTVEAICWRYYGRTAGVTEAVLEANRGLADTAPPSPQASRSPCRTSRQPPRNGRW